jgi:hypothetical protein
VIEQGRSADEMRPERNLRPGLRLAQGNLPERAGPHADCSESEDPAPSHTPSTGQAVAEDAATDEYAAHEEERTSSTTVQRH